MNRSDNTSRIGNIQAVILKAIVLACQIDAILLEENTKSSYNLTLLISLDYVMRIMIIYTFWLLPHVNTSCSVSGASVGLHEISAAHSHHSVKQLVNLNNIYM